jgi:hypothetical protein
MQLAHQAQRQGQHAPTLDAELQRGNVVAHLPQIRLVAVWHVSLQLVEQDIRQARAGAFNAGRQDGLTPHVRGDQQMRVG